MPGATGTMRPCAAVRAMASRFGVTAASSGVRLPCDGVARSPRPSSTSRTTFISGFSVSSEYSESSFMVESSVCQSQFVQGQPMVLAGDDLEDYCGINACQRQRDY